MTLNELSKKAYKAAKDKGFYDEPTEVGTRLMLIVSELAEALEASRKGDTLVLDLDQYRDYLNRGDDEIFMESFKKLVKDSFCDEIADTFIRLFDLCGWMDIDIEKHIELKMRYNSLRPHKHGKNY